MVNFINSKLEVRESEKSKANVLDELKNDDNISEEEKKRRENILISAMLKTVNEEK